MSKSRAYHGGFIEPTQAGTYRCWIRRFNKRWTATAKTKESAQDWIDDQNRVIERRHKPLSASQTVDAIDAVALLPPNTSLLKCVQYYLSHHTATTTISAADAAYKYCAAKEAERLAHATVRDARAMLKKFTAWLEVPLEDVTHLHVGEYILKAYATDVSRNALRRKLHAFFKWCQRQGYVAANPVENLSSARIIRDRPTYMPVDTVVQLFQHLEANAPAIIPYVAVGFFTGCRSAELDRLRKVDFDFERGEVVLEAWMTKTRDRRFIPLPENLQEWLRRYPMGATLKLPGKQHMKAIRGVLEAAGIAWERNTMRRTFTTMHVAAFKNAAQTALLLGHQDQAMLYKHYRAAAREEEAVRFWGVVPGTDK